jgi:hypothetical protein
VYFICIAEYFSSSERFDVLHRSLQGLEDFEIVKWTT